MTEIHKEAVQEAEFTEVEAQEEKEVAVGAEITIQVLQDGGMNLSVNEEYEKLSSQQVEEVVRSVHVRLQEQRIAAQALELFKSKLSF